MGNGANPDYCCTTPGSICFWFAAFAVLYGLGLLLVFVWPSLRGLEEAILFAALGLACLANFARNRTVHCAISAPLFLLAAAALGLKRAQVLSFPHEIVWPLVMIGIGIAFFIEWRVTGFARKEKAS